MDKSNKKGQKRVGKFKIKTFPVELKLEEIEESNINTINNSSNLSKEQLINEAFKLHSLGKVREAAKFYQYFINKGYEDENVFSNYGVILKNLGQLQQAEISYRKAIKLNPYLADSHCNLGNILRDKGHSKEAFFCYLKAIEINPELSNNYDLITKFLKDTDPSILHKSKLENILNLLLERNDISHKDLFKVFYFLYGNFMINHIAELDKDVCKIELIVNKKIILNALKKIIFCDIKLEKALTKIRRKICIKMRKDTKTLNYYELQFIIALGEQCFLNEYIYFISEEENISVNTIIERCVNGELNEQNVAMLSCYIPLYKLIDQIACLKSIKSNDQNFKELIMLQITEPLKEIELSQNIKKLGEIKNTISKKIKSQYNENPYPRWRYGNNYKHQNVSFTQVINNEIKPNFINDNRGDRELKILIAGCGTGHQLLYTQIYRKADIKGIDISLSSLSFAQRKINEMGIDNVKLILMDILEVNLLEEEFDIIECGGVLHHMEDPSKGLKALLGVLKKNGVIKLGFYSELARKEIVKARRYIEDHQIKSDETNIRNFRQQIISDEIEELSHLKTFSDFYSLSEFRDLCFHWQEHRFTISQLQETLQSNDLEFKGFLLPKTVKSLYKEYFPEDKKQIKLKNWSTFEKQYPNTFKGMYQFWACKTQN